jgi:ribosomal protein S18 acetylase RimI-like enzyme
MKTDDLRRKMEMEAPVLDEATEGPDNPDGLDELGEGEELEFECYMTERAEMDDLEFLLEIDEQAQNDPARLMMIEQAIRDQTCKLVADSTQVLAYGIFDHSYHEHGFVKMVFVHPEYRRQGVGADMLLGFEATCETPQIYAAIPLSNLEAQELFRSVGYVPVEGVPPSGNPSDPEVLYVKNIWEPMPETEPETVQ